MKLLRKCDRFDTRSQQNLDTIPTNLVNIAVNLKKNYASLGDISSLSLLKTDLRHLNPMALISQVKVTVIFVNIYIATILLAQIFKKSMYAISALSHAPKNI